MGYHGSKERDLFRSPCRPEEYAEVDRSAGARRVSRELARARPEDWSPRSAAPRPERDQGCCA